MLMSWARAYKIMGELRSYTWAAEMVSSMVGMGPWSFNVGGAGMPGSVQMAFWEQKRRRPLQVLCRACVRKCVHEAASPVEVVQLVSRHACPVHWALERQAFLVLLFSSWSGRRRYSRQG